MKITKFLAIGAMAFATHSAVHAQWANIDSSVLEKINSVSVDEEDSDARKRKSMEMPLASSPEPFSYSKEESVIKVSSTLENFRENKNSSKISLKLK
ncbi:hypothetical protein GW796_06430 [archaeon]|nr:hypothetical protein [archaeon]